jgi:carbon-monoxide dehydrogenase medium subunit
MRYEAPTTVEDAVRLLSEESGAVHVLAGGTDIIVQLNSGFVEPDLIVDIKRIPELNKITEEDDGCRIGAAVPCSELSAQDSIRARWPGVVEAAELIGSTQIQSRATIVGNLCNASPAADSVPAMVAAGATARIVGPDGLRDIAVSELSTGPGTTNLAAAEIVHSIQLPATPTRSGAAYLRFIPRSEMDIAVVGAAVNLTVNEAGNCTAARVALGAVAERVLLVEEAAQVLVGSSLDEATLERLAETVSAACRPIDDKRGTVEFRTKVAGVLAKRAAIIAAERARD